jgi:diaminopimelate decarboxylase
MKYPVSGLHIHIGSGIRDFSGNVAAVKMMVELAEEITGKTCIEYTDTDKPHIGYGFDGEEFEQPVFDDTPLVEAENGNS